MNNTKEEITVIAIAGIGKNRELGKGPDLLWPVSDDLKRFKEITTGHSIIMGKKTFDSIGQPLPNRQNIVLTRNKNEIIEGADIAHSIEEAINVAVDREVYIIGGGQIYALALPYTDKLYLTLFDSTEPSADVFFPEFEKEFTKKTLIDEREHEGLKYSWVNFERES